MTLRDLFVPNKFGTIPIIEVYAIGTVIYNPIGYADLYNDSSHKIIDLDTCITIKHDRRLRVLHPDIEKYNCEYAYLIAMTPENYLVNSAIEPIEKVKCLHDGILYEKYLTQRVLDTLHDDGSGWAEIRAEIKPVTFYVEDILYRLDLQGKLT